MYLLIYALLVLFGLSVNQLYKAKRKREEIDAIARQHGCLQPPMLQNQRPLGIDRLEQIFRANSESRLMELFLFHFRQTGYTLQQVFLLTPAFGTVDPANLKAMLSLKFSDWDNGLRRAIAFPMFGDGIFTQDGDSWKHSREILKPQFVYGEYENLDVFKEPIDDLLQTLSKRGNVDLQPLFFRFTLDVTTAFLFGESIYSLRSPVSAGEHTFASAFNTAQKYVAKRFRLLDLYWLVGGKEFRQACETVHRFADQIIDRNLNPNHTNVDNINGNFLNSLAKNCPDRVALRGQIINMLVAGRDTTACLLSWTFFLLVRHPHVMEKLRAEMSQLDRKTDALSRADLRKMRYLQNVIKETLRLYPSVPVNNRTAVRTTVLPTGGGPDRKSPVLIPKGTAVAYSVYTLHRRPDMYGMDAELFRPERWDEDMPLNHDPTSQQWGYLPFSGGPRTCLGMDFALTEAAYTIVRILQRYPTIKLPEGETVELTGVEKQTVTLVLQIKQGCKVELL
ncbi:Cytochrome P450 [Elaphomyces granulatus]